MDGDQIIRRALRVAEEIDACVTIVCRNQEFVGKVERVGDSIVRVDLHGVRGNPVIAIDDVENVVFARPI